MAKRNVGALMGAALAVALFVACSGAGGGGPADAGGDGGAASGGDAGWTIKWSCDHPASSITDHQCYDYVGKGWDGKPDDLKASKDQCNQSGSVASDAPCATDGVVATCDRGASDGSAYGFLNRYYAPTTVDQARNYCSAGGGKFIEP